MNKDASIFKPVIAAPVKDFFVTMLTRDIALEDAILDLLDNCVDGIQRNKIAGKAKSELPYKDFHADIFFSDVEFKITDNCGGISRAMADYAFRMGKPTGVKMAVDPSTVGTYGIGMKRAIFKMGRHCTVSTKNKDDVYEITISPEWMSNQDEWELPVSRCGKPMKDDGTTITIKQLNEDAKSKFGKARHTFEDEIIKKIQSHYSVIISKGFAVSINGTPVMPKPISLVFNKRKAEKKAMRPFMYQATIDGVSVFMTVGMTTNIPSAADIEDSQEGKRYSSMAAGWTIICNDRVVVYCDRTELTGWGEAGVPRYHTQFIAISGILEFKSKDPRLLPTTTTKRGIDASSLLYLRVKNKMREGLLCFTSYTNKWKSDPRESKKQIDAGDPMDIEALKNEFIKLPAKLVPTIGGKQYKPTLPLPVTDKGDTRLISFRRKDKEIIEIAKYLFNADDKSPEDVGDACFTIVLKESRE